MKFRRINIATAFAFATVLALTSCSKDDGAIPKDIGIEDIPVVSINLESSSTVFSATLNLADQANFQGKFKLSLFFDKATPPTKIDVVARKRNGTTSPVKVYKADITSLPASFTISASDLVTLFGAPLAVKDSIDFAPDLYANGKKYEAWPASGVVGSGSGVTGMSGVGFGEKITYIVK